MKRKAMRRILAGFLTCALMAGCLAGCGNDASNGQSDAEGTSLGADSRSEGSEEPSGTEGEGGGAEESSGEKTGRKPDISEPVTLNILTARGLGTADNTKDLYWFRWLEYWLKEQGYDVTINVEGVTDAADAISLRLGTGDLPDLVWGITLGATDSVKYGVGENMILNWSPYLNDEFMPNVMEVLETDPTAMAVSTNVDGGVYGLPYVVDRTWGWSTGTCNGIGNIYLNKKWLEKCELEVPQSGEEFIDMLRAFKNMELENGEEAIPYLKCGGTYLERYIWCALGYYGAFINHGSTLAIKDKEVQYAAYSDDYRYYVEFMNTLYKEGLISPDYYTMENDTSNALAKSGVCGAFGNGNLMLTITDTDGFEDWTIVQPIAMGENKEVYATVNSATQIHKIWASADTEYPELLAFIMDYFYSPEGTSMYYQGPLKGEDPLNLVDGWYPAEEQEGTMIWSCKLVEDGTYGNYDLYGQDYLYPVNYVGNGVTGDAYSAAKGGFELDRPVISVKDPVTGDTYDVVDKSHYTRNNSDGYYRWLVWDNWQDVTTIVKLPVAFLSEENAMRAEELGTLLGDYVTSESVKFITGTRPLSQVEDFRKELEGLGVEEYLEYYREGYASYMDSIF